MDFTLPDTSRALRETFADWIGDVDTLASTPASTASVHGADLRRLGFLDLLGPRSADADHQHLNVALVLEQLGRGGLVGPLAETLWAAAYGQPPASAADIVWCAAPSGFEHGGMALVPFGGRVSHLLVGADPPRLVELGDLARPAHTPALPGAHAWIPSARSDQPFERRAPAYFRISLAALTAGYCTRLIDLALRQTVDRVAFGRRLLTFQAPRFQVAECYHLVEALRLMVIDAAWRADRQDARGPALAAAAWIYAADVGKTVVRNVHQVMGAASFPTEMGVTPLTGALASLRLFVGTSAASDLLWRAWRRSADTPQSNVYLSLAP
jgi:acyl-CoA dehydrogenase-like protein